MAWNYKSPPFSYFFFVYIYFNIISLLFHLFSLIQRVHVHIHAILRYQQFTCTGSLLLLLIINNDNKWEALLFTLILSRRDVHTETLRKEKKGINNENMILKIKMKK